MLKIFAILSIYILSTQSFAVAALPKVIYGDDNRVDYKDGLSFYQTLAESTAAQIPHASLTIRGTSVEINGDPLMNWKPPGMLKPVCEKERYSHQPTASVCSGFFVSDDVLATAGHCMLSEDQCENFAWVVNYKITDENQSSISVELNDVYTCEKIIKVGYGRGLDFALIKLDRSNKGKAVKISKTPPALGTPIVMIGHPSGLPQKISDKARITSISGSSFRSNLDAFRGNSGSAVFNAESGELLGILVNGNADYQHNLELDCSEVNVLPDNEADEGSSSYSQVISYL